MLHQALKRLCQGFIASFLLVFVASTSLFAQESATYCQQLEAADCALISASAAAMQDVQSIETSSFTTFQLVDIPSMPFEEAGINYTQHSTFAIDPEAMTLIKDIQSMSTGELEQMMSNPIEAINFFETLLINMNLALEMDLELSEGILSLLNEEFRAETGMDLPAELGLQLRFIDGIIYMDMTTIAEMFPEIGAFVQGWVGVDAAPLLQMARNQMDAAGIDEDFSLDSSSAMDDNPFAAISMNQSGPLVAVVDSMDPTGEAGTYLSVERLVADNELVATYRTTMDYDQFMKSNAFRELVYAIMTNEGDTVSATELDETVTLAQIMAPAFLQDLQLELTEEIAQQTGYLMAGDLLLDWDLKSILTLASQSDPALRLEEGANPNLTFSSSTTNSRINEDITVEVPEGAFVVPMEMLMALMNS